MPSRPAARTPPRAIVRHGRVVVHYESAALSYEDAATFGELALRGLRELEFLSGLPARLQLRIELSAGTPIASARGRTIYLPLCRVISRSAPYLHEIAHVLFPCPRGPAWFSEGLAGYLEAVVSERDAGYDSHLFTPSGNMGVHADAAGWLADPRGLSVLPFVGGRGTPHGILADRYNVAAPFYVFSHSLVKFLADQVGLQKVMRVARAARFSRAVRRFSGKPATAWRIAWMDMLRRTAPLLNPPVDETPAGDKAL